MGALGANNEDLKNRRIAVTLADSRVSSRKPPPPLSGLTPQADAASRSVRIRNLPPNAQEGLLQQALEKVAGKIKTVEVFEGSGEGVVELETSAEASKLALLTEIVFQDHTLSFVEEAAAGPRKKAKSTVTKPKPKPKKAPTAAVPSSVSSAAPVPAPSVASFVPRAATSKTKPRAGLGHRKALGKGVGSSTTTGDVSMVDPGAEANANGGAKGGKDQDAFRRMLEGGGST